MKFVESSCTVEENKSNDEDNLVAVRSCELKQNTKCCHFEAIMVDVQQHAGNKAGRGRCCEVISDTTSIRVVLRI